LQSEESLAQRLVASGIIPVYSPVSGQGDSCNRSSPVKIQYMMNVHFSSTKHYFLLNDNFCALMAST